VTSLLEQARPARLGLAQLLCRLPVCVGKQLARLVARRVDDLSPLALALLPKALDLVLAPGELGLPAPDLLFGLADLRRRRALGVTLEHVGELGRLADQVQRVHADRVPGRLDVRALPGRLQDAELRLELDDVPPERVERLADAIRVVPAFRDGQVLHAWKRRDCGPCALF
jgi:hypothetical protein